MSGGKNIQSVNDARNITKNGQEDVDEEISIASTFQEDTDGWNEDSEDNLDDVWTGESHDDCRFAKLVGGVLSVDGIW